MRELLGSSRGTTMVEFALIVPVLLLLLFGILDLGRALNAYVTMSNASREGARYAMLHRRRRHRRRSPPRSLGVRSRSTALS